MADEWSLRRVYQYHRSEDVLVVRSEDFFVEDNSRVVRDIVAFASPHLARDEDWEAVKTIHVNSKVDSQEPMLNETRDMLQEFYGKHNAALERLLGHRMEW